MKVSQFVLGEGELFVELDDHEDITSIGVRPEDGRETEWMSIPSLYRAHCQTVRLYFEPAQPEATPIGK